MARPRKKKVRTPRVIKPIENPEYNKLETYCIWLNEYYNALRKAGFKTDIALSIIMDSDSYPDWVSFKLPSSDTIEKIIDEEDED